MANAFQTSAFFGTLRDIEKEKQEQRSQKLRLGLQERGVAVQERGQKFAEGQRIRKEEATKLKEERDRATSNIEATIANAGRSLAQVSLESGKNSGELGFTQQFNEQIEALSASAERLGLFSKAEIERKLQDSIDSEISRSLGAASGGVRNFIDADGEIISEGEQRRRVAGGEPIGNFRIAPTQTETQTGFTRKVGTAEQQNIRNAAVQVKSIIRSSISAKAALKFNPASASFVGGLTQFADNTANNLVNLVSQSAQLGITDINQQNVDEDIGRLRTKLKGLAGPVAQFNSALIDMSYSKALILNGARPTDQDVINAYESLTGRSNDPEIIIERLDAANVELIQNVQDRARLAGMDLGDFFDDVQQPGGGPQAGGGVAAIPVGGSAFQNGIEFIKQSDGSMKPKGN